MPSAASIATVPSLPMETLGKTWPCRGDAARLDAHTTFCISMPHVSNQQ